MPISPDEIRSQVQEQASKVEERLDHITDSYSMPELADMSLHSTKQFDLGIVFVDINGFTGYTSRNADKEVLFMLNLFVPEVMEIVRGFDGHFEKNTGDGIMAYFGAGEDDQTTAGTILEYISAVKYATANEINPVLEERGIEPITISAGATMGRTYISRIGVHSMNRRTAVSTSANVASKLEAASGNNEYYIGHRIRDAVRGHVADDLFVGLGQFENYLLLEDESGQREPFLHYDYIGGWEETDWEGLGY